MAARETSNRYARPPRPLPIALLNRVGRHLTGLGPLADLDVESVVAAARRKTGLTDYGDEWFREPLGVLIDSINREARLTPLGLLIQRARIVGALCNRLRAEELCRRHPEIRTRALGPVIVIAGLQRTGTTMLHRLLAADPDARSLRSWEALNPLPLPDERDGGAPRTRQAAAHRAEKALAYLAPDFFAIHPVEHDAPEEDVLLLDLSFMSQAPEAAMHVPTYAAWLEGQDHTRAYEYLRTLMQILLWQEPGRHWILKSPHHMEYLDTVLRVFPEARIVQTHRDPRTAVTSFCSMVAHGRGVFSDDVDPIEVARHWTRKVRRLMERSIAVRATADPSRFLDVSYYALVEDPIAQLRRIYDFAGIAFTADVERAARAMQARNVQHKYGRHRYRLEDFGLAREQLDRDFAFYRERYGVPTE
jgi:hypothetical protein